MPETVLHTLVTVFEADTSGMAAAVSDLDSLVSAATGNMAGNIAGLESAVGALASAATAHIGQIGSLFGPLALGGLGAVAGLVASLTGVGDALAKIGDRAQDLRLTPELLAALGIAAAQARVSQNDLNSALDHFTAASKQADSAGNAFYKALRNVGDGFATAFKDAPTQQARLEILGRALSSTSSEVTRLQLAQQAFGTQNERVVALFAQLAAGADTLEAKAAALGITIDQGMVQKAQAAQAQSELLWRVLHDKLLVIFGDLLPAARDLIPYIEQLAKAFSTIVQTLAPANDRSAELLSNQIKMTGNAIDEVERRIDNFHAKMNAQAAAGGPSLWDKIIGHTPAGMQGMIDAAEQELDGLRTKYAELQNALAGKVPGAPGGHAPDKPPPAFKPQPSLSGDGKDNFDRQVESLNKHVAALEADTLAVGRNQTQTEQFKAELLLLQAAQRDGGEVTNAQIEAYTKLRETMSAQQALAAAGIKLNKDHADSFDQVSQRVAQAAKALADAKNSYAGLQDVVKTLGDDTVEVFGAMLSGTKSLSQQLASILQQIEKQLLQAAIVGSGPFAKIFGFNNESGGVGGLFGALLSGFSGFHDAGGAIPAGGWGVVGEFGPEIVHGPATVIPRGTGLGAGGPQSIAVNVSVSGARGSKEIEDAVHAGTARAMAYAGALIKGYDASLATRLVDLQQRLL